MLSIRAAPPIPTFHVQRKLPVFNHLSSLIIHIVRSCVVRGGGELVGWLAGFITTNQAYLGFFSRLVDAREPSLEHPLQAM